MKIAAIIPTLNEFTHLAGVVEQVKPHVDHVIVVDDGSKRPLADTLKPNPAVTVIRHRINLGKGAAMMTGVRYASSHQFDAVVFLDADGQHDPAEIPKLLAPIQAGQADIVFGVREFHHTMPTVAKLGNIFLTTALSWLYGIPVRDTQSGYRALRLSRIKELAWSSPRYAVETEMIVNAGRHQVPWTEVPIRTIYLDAYRGTTVLDGIRIFINMITWRFR